MRPAFLVFGFLSLVASAAAELSPAASPVRDRQALLGAIAPLHESYDPEVNMVREPFRSPGYHTTLKSGFTHPTRSSINYALACLDTGDPELLKRAELIINKVISLQDQDPARRTYGIWSWFLEEPLAKMSPPDWNWADFIGAGLVQIALDHRSRLSPETALRVKEAILHAARSIQRRNVGPGYTNIAIMGSYVTLVAGELYGWTEVLAYGRARWQRFYDYTRELGAFNEYNSPTYTLVALREIARIRAHVQDEECRRIADSLNRLAWEEIAMHFHAPSGQWSGPHSRAYRNLLSADVYALFRQATGGAAELDTAPLSMSELRVPQQCPPEYIPYLQGLQQPREVIRTYAQGTPPVVGTTYLTPLFAIGSVNTGDLWNQRRPLIAYWGSRAKPAWFRIRFLHDDYDFSAAQIYSRQKKGRVLAGIAFATDGGDTHVSLYRLRDGAFKARDLRLRFEWGGSASIDALHPPAGVPGFVNVPSEGVNLGIAVQQAVFGSLEPHWEKGRGGEACWMDLVFYSGAVRDFKLNEITRAGIGLAVAISDRATSGDGLSSSVADGLIRQRWDDLELVTPL
jgi:hypothetical protein